MLSAPLYSLSLSLFHSHALHPHNLIPPTTPQTKPSTPICRFCTLWMTRKTKEKSFFERALILVSEMWSWQQEKSGAWVFSNGFSKPTSKRRWVFVFGEDDPISGLRWQKLVWTCWSLLVGFGKFALLNSFWKELLIMLRKIPLQIPTFFFQWESYLIQLSFWQCDHVLLSPRKKFIIWLVFSGWVLKLGEIQCKSEAFLVCCK